MRLEWVMGWKCLTLLPCESLHAGLIILSFFGVLFLLHWSERLIFFSLHGVDVVIYNFAN